MRTVLQSADAWMTALKPFTEVYCEQPGSEPGTTEILVRVSPDQLRALRAVVATLESAEQAAQSQS